MNMIPEMKKTFSRVKDKLAEKVIRQQVVTRIGFYPPKDDSPEEIKRFNNRIAALLEMLNKNEPFDVWAHMKDSERKLAKNLAAKYKKYLKYLSADNIMLWLMYDVPILYGILIGHPNGRTWLEKTLSKFLDHLIGDEIELKIVEDTEEGNKE